MKEKLVILLMFGGILFYTGIAGSGDDVENKGAEIILLSGGKMRDVHFPHHRHQDVLGDCNICHDLFPQKLGSIEELKNQGKLEKKTSDAGALHKLPQENESGRPEYRANFLRKMPQKNRITGKGKVAE